MDVGWSPVVTAILTRGDGSKAMAGFGKTNGVVVKAWMTVMWGAASTGNPCNATPTAANAISGYVQMVPSVQVTRTTTTNCNLTASAYVDYFYSEQAGVNAANTA